MAEDILVPLMVFGIPGAVIAYGLWLRFRSREVLAMTVRHALDSGQPLDSDIVERLFGDTRTDHERDFRRGVILLAITGAIAILGIVDHMDEDIFAAASFPGLVGLAYLFLARRGSSAATTSAA